METNHQRKLREYLLVAADELRPPRARVSDLLDLVRYGKSAMGLPTRRSVRRLLRSMRAVAVVDRDQDLIERIDNVFAQTMKYREKRKIEVEQMREKKRVKRELLDDPGNEPGPAYGGFEWQFDVQRGRVIWRMVETEERKAQYGV